MVSGQEPEEQRLLLSIPQACFRLGFGRTKLYEYVSKGDIQIVKIGQRTLIPQASLVEFVDRLSAQAPAA